MIRRTYAYGLMTDLLDEGYKMVFESSENGNVVTKVVMPDSGYEITESSARETVEDAIIEAFMDTPDLETAREIEADDIPF